MLSQCWTLHKHVSSLSIRVWPLADWITRICYDLKLDKNKQAEPYWSPTTGRGSVNWEIIHSHLDLRQDFAFARRRNRVHPQTQLPVQNALCENSVAIKRKTINNWESLLRSGWCLSSGLQEWFHSDQSLKYEGMWRCKKIKWYRRVNFIVQWF